MPHPNAMPAAEGVAPAPGAIWPGADAGWQMPAGASASRHPP
jgi:hypothetical protein